MTIAPTSPISFIKVMAINLPVGSEVLFAGIIFVVGLLLLRTSSK
jgi:hypothetical protein